MTYNTNSKAILKILIIFINRQNQKVGKLMTESTKKIRKTTITIQTIFCSLTVILTVLYVLDIQSGINLTTVNVLCFSFYFTQLAPGLLECNNHQKAQWLLAAVFISAIVTSLNLWIDYRTVNEFHLSVLSGWCFTWIILLLTASVSTISILIRLLDRKSVV